MLFFADDSDTSPTTRCGRFHYVHVFITLHLSFINPSLVIFWEYICGRRYIIISSMASSHFEDIPPQIVFSAQLPTTGEMIDFLVLINIF